MIDKNGKLFGKINIIDLLIILVIIAAAVFFATKAFTPAQEAAKTDTSTVRVQFFCYKAQVGAADAIEIGAPAFEDTTNVDFGKVVAVESEPSYTYFVDADGNQAKAEVAYNDAVTVTVELPGQPSRRRGFTSAAGSTASAQASPCISARRPSTPAFPAFPKQRNYEP